MSPSQKVRIDDLPPDMFPADYNEAPSAGHDWQTALREHLNLQFAQQRENILDQLQPAIETILITTALQHTGQRKIEAAKLLGWGRNTLTRKLKELKIDA